MKVTKEEIRRNLSMNKKNRSAKFVLYKTGKLESFKNSKVYSIIRKIQPKFQNLKRWMNAIIGKPRLWASIIDWKQSSKDSSVWFIEAVIEGAMANWWTHKIFGLDFGVGMIIAHGFLIKQGLDIHRRIKKDGQYSKLLTKNK